MSHSRILGGLLAGLLGVAASLPAALAEDVERKFRVALAAGGFNALDDVGSDAANVLSITNEDGEIVDRFIDPRQDSAAVGAFEIQGGSMATVSLQYAVSKIFLFELAGGYQKADVGQLELQAETFAGQWLVVRIPIGELERVPFQLSALARFRPRADFNPYAGIGVGYTVIGFEPSPELDQLSFDLDASLGRQARLTSEMNGSQVLLGSGSGQNLDGARVSAEDTFTWHVLGGAEYSFHRNWAAFVDVRYLEASRRFALDLNGETDVGVSVPRATVRAGSPEETATYGPLEIVEGGLIDANGDGQPDRGFYYVKDGRLDYNGLSFQAGIRYTF